MFERPDIHGLAPWMVEEFPGLDIAALVQRSDNWVITHTWKSPKRDGILDRSDSWWSKWWSDLT